VPLPLLSNLFSDGSLVPLAVALVAVFLLMSSLRRRQQRQPQRPPKPLRDPPAQHRQQTQRDLEELMVELQELSRRINAEIDTRFAKLESAMRDADRRISVLNRLTRQGAGNNAQEGSSASADTRHAAVYELADAGFSPLDIAKDLGKTPGEIELILNLRKQAADKQ
jgi:hypothetical protein